MNVESVVNRAGRLIVDIERQARTFLAKDWEAGRATAGQLGAALYTEPEEVSCPSAHQELTVTRELAWLSFPETRRDSRSALEPSRQSSHIKGITSVLHK
jgi:hypothetical protein